MNAVRSATQINVGAAGSVQITLVGFVGVPGRPGNGGWPQVAPAGKAMTLDCVAVPAVVSVALTRAPVCADAIDARLRKTMARINCFTLFALFLNG